jgi:hypothetical protein
MNIYTPQVYVNAAHARDAPWSRAGRRLTKVGFWAHTAAVFACVSAVFVSANYVVRLATVIPAKLNDATLPIRMLERASARRFGLRRYWQRHGFATLFAAQAMPRSGSGRLVRQLLYTFTNALDHSVASLSASYSLSRFTRTFAASRVIANRSMLRVARPLSSM